MHFFGLPALLGETGVWWAVVSTKLREGRPQAQTVREWVYEFEVDKPVWPAAWGKPDKGYISTPEDFDPGFQASPPSPPGQVVKYVWIKI